MPLTTYCSFAIEQLCWSTSMLHGVSTFDYVESINDCRTSNHLRSKSSPAASLRPIFSGTSPATSAA